MAREFDRQGLGYVLRVPELATEIAVDHLIRTRGSLEGEVRISCGLDGIPSTDGHVHQARANLSTTSARGTLARYLNGRANVQGLDWADLLEDFCRRVLDAERSGDPVERVGALPLPLAVTNRVAPIMPEDQVTIMYGDGSTGKSTIASAIAVSVETGAVVIPGWVPRKAPVLYLDWEAGAESVNRRVRGVAMGANAPGGTTIAYRNCKRRGALPGFAEDLAREVDGEGYGLVIVDSVGMASGIGDGGDANETALRLFGAFGILGTTVLAIDHVAKTEADRTDRHVRAYGSIYKSLLARATYELRRGKSPDGRWLLGIHNTKLNDGDELPDVALKVHHEPDGSIRYERLEVVPDMLKVGVPTIWEALRDILETGDYTTDELAAAAEKPKASVRSTLYRVKATDGLVEVLPSSKKWRLIRRVGAAGE